MPDKDLIIQKLHMLAGYGVLKPEWVAVLDCAAEMIGSKGVEPFKVIPHPDDPHQLTVYYCGDCKSILGYGKHQNYCHTCGRKVKW